MKMFTNSHLNLYVYTLIGFFFFKQDHVFICTCTYLKEGCLNLTFTLINMIGTIANERQQMLLERADKGLEMNKSKTRVMMENNTQILQCLHHVWRIPYTR